MLQLETKNQLLNQKTYKDRLYAVSVTEWIDYNPSIQQKKNAIESSEALRDAIEFTKYFITCTQ